MDITTGEKIKIIMKRQNMTASELAERTGQSRQNLSNKMARDNYSEKEMRDIAAAMGCTVQITFTLPDGSQI